MMNIRYRNNTNAWPGFVDLFSNLVIILIFLLIMFLLLWTTTSVFNKTTGTRAVAELKQANAEEQNPLTSEIRVNTSVDGASFEGYNYLTGAYTFHVDGYSLGAALRMDRKSSMKILLFRT